ncbi:MAG TPA: hypothetical protein VJN96_09260 [Vicinamibacterales bacterium]|nr:hypothetical protein [Vicinamibacterales bacterium]
MPSTPGKERSLLRRFLTAYDHGDWDDPNPDWVDERMDGAVEVVARRKSDGATLAIEHTIIQPRPQEKEDFARFSRAFDLDRRDPSLERPESYIYVDVPFGALQKGEDWSILAHDVCECIRRNKESIPEGWSQLPCATTVGKDITLRVRLVHDAGSKESRTLIRRYGSFDLASTVRTALSNKLPKLVATAASRRLLMFERDQWHVDHVSIATEIEEQRASFPQLSLVDEIWIAETHENQFYVLFEPLLPGRPYSPMYTFHGDVLHRAPGY